jgi:hypothetical protein
MSDSDLLTLIVVEPDIGVDGEDTKGLPEESVELQSVIDKARFWRSKPKQVKLGALKDRMEEVQGEVEGLLAGLKKPVGDYRLAEVQVSLAISGSGSIGVATVGAEASIALTFSPSS